MVDIVFPTIKKTARLFPPKHPDLPWLARSVATLNYHT